MNAAIVAPKHKLTKDFVHWGQGTGARVKGHRGEAVQSFHNGNCVAMTPYMSSQVNIGLLYTVVMKVGRKCNCLRILCVAVSWLFSSVRE